MADKPVAYSDLPPAPTAPELPIQRPDEDADAFTMRVAKAYRHGNIWTVRAEELAHLLLQQVSGNEPLRPATRDEAVDILSRLVNMKESVSQITRKDHKPEHILPAELRQTIHARISGELPKVDPQYACAAG